MQKVLRTRLAGLDRELQVDLSSIRAAIESISRQFKLGNGRFAASGAKRVLALGCGEGKLLRELLKDRQFGQIVGLDVSIRSLEVAADRLRMDRMTPNQAERIKLLHGSLIYRDRRLHGLRISGSV